MRCSKLAIAIIVMGGMSAVAHGQTTQPRSFTPSAYEYGNYDYYAQPEATPSPSDKPAPPPAAAAAGPSCNAAPSCAAAPACNGCNNCGCDSCCKKKCHPLIQIEECCPLECEDAETCRIFGDCCCLNDKGIAVFGWVSGGIMGNADAPASRFNGPVTFADRDSGQMNQLYLVGEKAIDADNCGWAWGGRVDYLYGSDYFFTTAAGLDGTRSGNVPRWGNNNFRYGSALPQLYAEVAYDDLKVKFGHFYTIIGYEVVPAIGNFFYTHAYTMQYGEPFTHTGILASKPVGDNLTAYAGITNGWDNWDGTSRANFLGGLTYASDDWGSLAFAIHTGDESVFAPGTGPFANRTVYSIVWSRTFTSRFTYVLQSDYGNQQNVFNSGTDAEWYGVNQYLFYKLNCCWTAGARIEWFRDDDGARVTGLRPGNPIAGDSFAGNFYEVTLGLNWKPNANLIVRPEVRWDWYDGLASPGSGNLPYNDGTSSNQFLYGLDAIYQF